MNSFQLLLRSNFLTVSTYFSFILVSWIWIQTNPDPQTNGNIVWPIIVSLAVFLLSRDAFRLVSVPLGQKNFVFDRKSFLSDIRNSAISPLDAVTVFSRIYAFPAVLTAYLLYLLLKETAVFPIPERFFLSQIEYVLLWIVAFSSILALFRERLDEKYDQRISRPAWNWWFLLLNFILAPVSSYFIFRQISELWILSFPISVISGLLVFVIGMTIFEEKNEIRSSP